MGLAIYKPIEVIKEGEHKSIYIVRSEIDHLLYIQRKLEAFDRNVYEKIKQIDSPLIPRIKEIIEENHYLYIIEEYINAPTLSQALLNGEIAQKEINNLMVEVCDALSLLHAYHIVHRDVKAENILYNKGHIVLIDFDISREYDENQSQDTQILGSVGYAAPEQFGFSQSDERTDIYALGVLYHYMLTLELPTKIIVEGHEGKVIRKALEIDPKNRYQSVNAMKKAIIGYNDSKYRLLGYKSDKKVRKVVASLLYIILFGLLCVCEVEGYSFWSFEAWYTKFIMVGWFIILLVFISNYRNVHQYCIGVQCKNKLIRVGGIVLSWVVIEFVYMAIAALLM